MEEVSIKKLDLKQLKEKNINSWPIWEKEISQFDWYYESTEECFILEGEIVVYTETKQYEIKSGDFVTFAKGLQCKWEVKKPVRKHYQFI